LLYTISQQQQQINSLRQQSSKEDVVRSIDKLEADLEKLLTNVNITINFDNGSRSISVYDILFKPSAMGYIQAIPTETEILDKDSKSKISPDKEERIILFEVFGLVAAEINQIRLYAMGLQQLEIKSGTTILARYYQRKYKLAYSRLTERGYLKECWETE
jgi:hypothetical protein